MESEQVKKKKEKKAFSDRNFCEKNNEHEEVKIELKG